MTPKQYQLLRFIRDSVVHMGKSPTYREMKAFMEVGSNQAIDDLLTGLEKGRYIKRQEKMRGITMTTKGLGYEENFVLQPEERFSPLVSHGQISNVSTSSVSQASFFQTTGINNSISDFDSLLQKGGEKDGNTKS